MIAIPTFHNRVAPRFDCAREFLLVCEGDRKPEHADPGNTIDASSWPWRVRPRKLAELGVSTVICGAIDRTSAASLHSLNIAVFPWVTGTVADVLTCYKKNKLVSYSMVGPGGRCRGRWRFHESRCTRD